MPFLELLSEAHRCLKLDGHLHIVEATSRFKDVDQFTSDLEKLGFDVVRVEQKYKFTFIRAMKNDNSPESLQLKF